MLGAMPKHGREHMTYELENELNFPETDEDLIRNAVVAQSILYTLFEPLMHSIYGGNEDAQVLFRMGHGLIEAAETHVIQRERGKNK